MSRPGIPWATALLVLLCGACAPAAGSAARPTPSPSGPPPIPVPDFNSRLGSNRVAAEAAASVGRQLFAQGQYWEVYLRTQPATLSGAYDPGEPAANTALAAQVTGAEMIIATESPVAIRAFGTGGDAHERQQLQALDALVRAAFPNLGGETVRVFYGESLQHGVAVFDHGRLVTYEVRKVG